MYQIKGDALMCYWIMAEVKRMLRSDRTKNAPATSAREDELNGIHLFSLRVLVS